jgi:hypothetical protein
MVMVIAGLSHPTRWHRDIGAAVGIHVHDICLAREEVFGPVCSPDMNIP